MKKRNKLAIAIAVVAVLLFAGAGLARFALTQTSSTESQIVPVEEVREGEDSTSDNAGSTATAKATEEEAGFAQYFGTTWKSLDGTSQLTIMDGTMVEKTDTPQSIFYFDIEGEEESGSSLSVEANLRTAANAEAALSIIKIDTSQDAIKLTCDTFTCSNTYVLSVADTTELEIASWNDNLASVTGKTKEELTDALSSWASSKSPYATKATWDKEVYINYADNTVVTSFTLDDGAGTNVQVQVDKTTGSLEVL